MLTKAFSGNECAWKPLASLAPTSVPPQGNPGMASGSGHLFQIPLSMSETNSMLGQAFGNLTLLKVGVSEKIVLAQKQLSLGHQMTLEDN